MAELDTSGLQPLDTTGLQPVNDAGQLDTSSLQPLDMSGLQPVDEQPSLLHQGLDIAKEFLTGPSKEEFEKAGITNPMVQSPLTTLWNNMVPFSAANRQHRAELEAQAEQMRLEFKAAGNDQAKIDALRQKYGGPFDDRNPGYQLAQFIYQGVGPSAEAANELRAKPMPEALPEATPRPVERATAAPPSPEGLIPIPDTAPPPTAQGTIFGFKNDDGSISRGVIESIDNGIVAWKTEDGTTHFNHVDDLTQNMAPPPEPSAARDNATTVPAPEVEQPAAPTPTAADVNEFNPWEESPPAPPREPPAPSPQETLALPDTTTADSGLAAARTLRRNAAEAQRIADTGASNAKSPDEISLMHRQAEALEQEALQRQRAMAAKPTGAQENLPPVRETAKLGPLGRTEPVESEATTGQSLTEPGSPAKRSEIEAAQRETPLLNQEPAPGAELPPPDTSVGRMGELGAKAPAETEASTGQSLTSPGSPAKRAAPMDILQAVADAGGLKDDLALKHDNSPAGRAAKRGGELDYLYNYPAKGPRKAASVVVPGKGVRTVINNKTGLSPDYMRENLIERGFLPEGATVDDMHAALRRTQAGDRQYSVHGPNSDINDVVRLQEEQAAAREQDKTAALGTHEQEVRDSLGSDEPWFGNRPTQEDVDALDSLISPEMMGALRPEEHDTLMGRLDEALPPEVINEAKEGTHEGDFAKGPAAEGNPPAERIPSSGPESETVAREPGGGEEGSRVPEAAERGHGEVAVTPPTERTPEGEQFTIPGTEPSARQAAAARPERLRAEAEQKPADEGLFARPEAEQLDIEKESGYRPGVKLSAGFDPFEIYGRIKDAVTRAGDALKLSPRDRGTAGQIAGAVAKEPPGVLKRGALKAIATANRYLSFASTVASRDPIFARYYASDLMRERYREALERDGGASLTKYEALTDAGRANVDKVLEHDRLTGYDRRNFGTRTVARMPEEYAGTKAKSGETVVLTPEETAALKDLRTFFDSRLTDIGTAMTRRLGYQGEFTPEAMRAEAAGAETSRGKTAAARALDVYNMIQDARRKGYVPFQRYGNHWIRVSTKPGYEPGKDGLQPGHTVSYEFMDTGAPQSDAFVTGGKEASRQTVEQRVAELRKQYPAREFDITHDAVTPNSLSRLDIPAMEKLFAILSQKDPHLSDALYDNVMTQIYDEAKAGFRKQANNTPGYSGDFERAIADYVRQSSRVVSDMEMGRKVDDAFEATQQHQDPMLRDYAKAYKDHLESGRNDFAMLRKIGFFENLWGSAKAAVTNLTQTPLVTMSQLSTWAGARAPLAAHQALLEALGAIRITPRGLDIAWDKLGRTPEEKAMIAQLRREGVLDPIVSKDLQGADASKNPNLRGIAKGAKAVYDAGASGFNVSEQANRIAAALSAFRMARMPELFQKMQQVYAKDNLFHEMVGRNGTPTDAARFMTDETQFIGGKRGRPPVMRGPGAVILQFKQYPANYFRLLSKNLSSMGPQGKMAATLMLGTLAAGAGVEGEPFVQDILKAYEGAAKMATGIDPMIEYRFANALRDMGLSPEAAEMMMHGATRGTPVDMSGSLGMGNIAPDDTSILSSIPVLSATLGKANEAIQRYNSGQPLAAAGTVAQMVLGRGPSDLIKGLGQLPSEGYQTQYGDLVIPPSQITPGEIAAKSLGFQPTQFSRESEFRQTEKRLKSATQQASSELLSNIAKNIALADDARKAGRLELARSYDADNDRLFQANAAQLADAGIPDWQKVPAPQRSAIRQRALGMINYQLGQMKTAGKTKREAMGDYPLPH